MEAVPPALANQHSIVDVLARAEGIGHLRGRNIARTCPTSSFGPPDASYSPAVALLAMLTSGLAQEVPKG
jgi:hypothetical protein